MTAARLFILSCIAYGFVVIPFSGYMKQRPLNTRLGYVPEAEVLRLSVADQKLLASEWLALKVIFYFGSIFTGEEGKNMYKTPPEYFIMFKTLQTAAKLDPYNMDVYFFAEAVFTWEVGRAREVNNLLEHGMRYRTWDYMLPFFTAFNSAYFLKDYKTAAAYMQRAADLSGNPLFTNLAARFFHQAGQTDLGILFIDSMEKSAKDEDIRKSYTMRKEALLAAKKIEEAVMAFKRKYGGRPRTIDELVTEGILPHIPADPYGGHFFIAPSGAVESTSKFAFGSTSK